MHTVMDVAEYARFYYKTGEPTKAQMNVVRRMCVDGTIGHAEKMGRRWFIDCTAEWPSMFPDADAPKEEPKAVVTAEVLADALALLLDELLERMRA